MRPNLQQAKKPGPQHPLRAQRTITQNPIVLAQAHPALVVPRMVLPIVPSAQFVSAADGRPGWLYQTRVARAQWLAQRGEPGYRQRQIDRWIFHRRVDDFEQMTDLPVPLRHDLRSSFRLWTSRVARHHRASDGTEKLVLQLQDTSQVECVLLRDGGRRTVCLSSQVGCAMGCVFCASGLDGVQRNLHTAEILEQLGWLARLLAVGERLSHIVMMGMGEPLANVQAVIDALQVASSPDGLGISPRRITISTVGLPAAIERLAEHHPRYHLAVSLHAPDNALRDQLVPVNRRIGLDAILAASDRYFEASGRRLTFEYVLLAGINDQPSHAQQLARRLRGRPALLNVIPYNPVAGLPYKTPAAEQVERFCRVLTAARLNVQVRQRKGNQISAACGQLRRQPQAARAPGPET